MSKALAEMERELETVKWDITKQARELVKVKGDISKQVGIGQRVVLPQSAYEEVRRDLRKTLTAEEFEAIDFRLHRLIPSRADALREFGERKANGEEGISLCDASLYSAYKGHFIVAYHR